MATSNPPAPPQPLTPEQEAANITLLKRNIAIGLVIACPILIALPPRKLDFFTFTLSGATFVSMNHLQKHYTGSSILNRLGVNRTAKTGSGDAGNSSMWDGLPTEKAKQYQQMMRLKKEAEAAGRTWVPPSIDELAKVKPEEKKGVLESVWMGAEGEDWKTKRDRKEREAIERGDGVGTMIQDYFAEAFGLKKDGEDDQEDGKEEKR